MQILQNGSAGPSRATMYEQSNGEAVSDVACPDRAETVCCSDWDDYDHGPLVRFAFHVT